MIKDPFKDAELYYLKTPYACGGVFVQNHVIIHGAPIFKKLLGQRIDALGPTYKARLVNKRG